MKSKYAMSEQQVETLASEYAAASAETSRINGTYLRVLVIACQAILGKVKRGNKIVADTQLSVLTDVSDKYYAAVLRGVTTPDVAHDDKLSKEERTRRSLERNRRSTFARSNKSTLASWISVAGGDLRSLDGETVTRDPLLAAVREARGDSELEHKLDRHKVAIVRLITQEARGDPDAARGGLERMIEALQGELDAMHVDGNRAPVSEIVTAPTRTRQASGVDPLSMTGVLKTRPVHARHAGARA
jgi:hypothetical protein